MHHFIRYIIFSLILGLSQPLFAQDNYQQWVSDITNRLNNTEQLLKENKIEDAKTEVQMAYFEVFENLEGPIRINFSAQKSYQMEATFGEIRKNDWRRQTDERNSSKARRAKKGIAGSVAFFD